MSIGILVDRVGAWIVCLSRNKVGIIVLTVFVWVGVEDVESKEKNEGCVGSGFGFLYLKNSFWIPIERQLDLLWSFPLNSCHSVIQWRPGSTKAELKTPHPRCERCKIKREVKRGGVITLDSSPNCHTSMTWLLLF